ncbi:MAG TPA: DUF1572 domain-containing protein [Terracidiphilus sp.]|nr:DUF1572 domain-containing protein [Terracidiphilus sp.]
MRSPDYTRAMGLQFTTSYLEDSLALLRYYKKLAERAMEQVADEHLFTALDAEANSIAIIVKHMTGNMRSRWTDFLTTDGEKPSRNRDGEFVDPPPTREALMADWDSGWACVFAALESLTDQDLARTVTIRGEAHSVMQAINRQLAHYPHHIGQIVLLAKHFGCDHWQSLSVPRNRSAEFNQRVAAGEASQR